MTKGQRAISTLLAIIAAILALATSAAAQELGDYAGARETEHPDWFKESFLDFEDALLPGRSVAASSGARSP